MPAYSYWRRITIDCDLVGEDDSDFTFLFSSTIADLATVGNGGRIENTASGGVSGSYTVPADLVFADQADGTGVYDFEIEKYDAATGEIIAWVQSGVSSAVDFELYLVYGDKETTASQEDHHGTWDSSYRGVWHLAEASGNALDSTSYNRHMSAVNTPTYQAAGKVGFAMEFSDESSEYLTVGGGAVTDCPLTFQALYKPDEILEAAIVMVGDPGGGADFHCMFSRVTYMAMQTQDGVQYARSMKNVTVTIGVQYFLTGIVTSNTHRLQYVDAVPAAANTTNRDARYLQHTCIAVKHGGGLGWYASGIIDEVRISSVVRTPAFITTNFNTQTNPGAFYGVSEPDRVRPASAASLPGLLIA